MINRLNMIMNFQWWKCLKISIVLCVCVSNWVLILEANSWMVEAKLLFRCCKRGQTNMFKHSCMYKRVCLQVSLEHYNGFKPESSCVMWRIPSGLGEQSTPQQMTLEATSNICPFTILPSSFFSIWGSTKKFIGCLPTIDARAVKSRMH